MKSTHFYENELKPASAPQPAPAAPVNGLQTGVWFSNNDFYRYRGKLPIVVEGLDASSRKVHAVLSGCVTCKLGLVRAWRETRWLILPP